jgi:hypothetical protein
MRILIGWAIDTASAGGASIALASRLESRDE